MKYNTIQVCAMVKDQNQTMLQIADHCQVAVPLRYCPQWLVTVNDTLQRSGVLSCLISDTKWPMFSCVSLNTVCMY
jgi:hypothetical protein